MKNEIHKSLSLFGIPLGNRTKDQTVADIFALINQFDNDRKSRYVATINVDFLVNTLSWHHTSARYPELLSVLRHADIVTADGMPLVWMSKLLGTPLTERVTGADIVPKVAGVAATKNKSIYLLGGDIEVAKNAAEILKRNSPGLAIAGVSSPFVHVEGQALGDVFEEDVKIIDEINASGADILMIAFGNPKQEIWFNRNWDKLKVPVSLGIGGTFSFITADVKRAPIWMQKSGLEWIYRISQDPKRLWKRYFKGFFKMIYMAAPIIIENKIRNGFRSSAIRQSEHSQKINTVEFGFINDRFKLINLPENCSKKCIEHFQAIRTEARIKFTYIIDFKNVKHIDPYFMAYLQSVFSQFNRENRKYYLPNISTHLKSTLKINRIWDYFHDHTCDDNAQLMKRIKAYHNHATFSYSLEHNYVARNNKPVNVLNIFGDFDVSQINLHCGDEFLGKIKNQDLIIDMTYCTFIDSAAIGKMVKINNLLKTQRKHCVLCNLNKAVYQALRITKVDQILAIASNYSKAEKLFSSKTYPPNPTTDTILLQLDTVQTCC